MFDIRTVLRARWKHLTSVGVLVLLLAAAASMLYLRQSGVPGAETGQETSAAGTPPGTSAKPFPSGRSDRSDNQETGEWPGPGNTGVPADWRPTATRTSNLEITTAGAVVRDLRLVNANLIIAADNVTVQRVELQGGSIVNDPGPVCSNGLVIENVSLLRGPEQPTRSGDLPAIQAGGYTARRVRIDGRPEGFRVAGKSLNCGRVTIEDSFARVRSPDICEDWHGDGVQGYDGPALVVRNVTLDLVQTATCGGTAPFFYPADAANTSVDVDRLLVKGGGYPFRLDMPGSVHGLRVVDGSWAYGPIDVKCSLLSAWDAEVVTIGPDYQPIKTVRSLPCNT